MIDQLPTPERKAAHAFLRVYQGDELGALDFVENIRVAQSIDQARSFVKDRLGTVSAVSRSTVNRIMTAHKVTTGNHFRRAA